MTPAEAKEKDYRRAIRKMALRYIEFEGMTRREALRAARKVADRAFIHAE